MGQSGVGIVTDSTAYLPEDLLREHSVSVIPLAVNLEGLCFREGEMSNSEFYRRLRQSKVLPTTSQPSLGEFVRTYEELGAIYESIISIHISGKLSGTVTAAETAKGMLPHLKIEVFDSLTTCTSLGFQVLAAAQAARAGRSKAEILQLLNWLRRNLRLLFMVGNLEYLHRGGRIGGAQALLGCFLEIKPILYMPEGRIDVFERVRTRPRAIKRMLEVLRQDLAGKELGQIAVLHVDAPGEVARLLDALQQEYPGLTIPVYEVGPVIGSHVGPDSVGLVYGPKPPDF
ncbi:MAG: DegV family protein [Syntrophomonadaceae bacterium]|nr:DegV family protein [Syntrophomonadaceae bacterium]